MVPHRAWQLIKESLRWSKDDYEDSEKPQTGMGALIKLYREERHVTQWSWRQPRK